MPLTSLVLVPVLKIAHPPRCAFTPVSELQGGTGELKDHSANQTYFDTSSKKSFSSVCLARPRHTWKHRSCYHLLQENAEVRGKPRSYS